MRTGRERVAAANANLPQRSGFHDLVSRMRRGDRDAFEALFDVFFLYVHYHAELSGGVADVASKVREQVTQAALQSLFEELLEAPADGPEEIRAAYPTWTRRALELASAARQQVIGASAQRSRGR